MKLIVGLGNPGNEYENTRHNIGFMVVDKYLNNPKYKTDKYADVYKTKIESEDVLFIKPLTFMNLSGNAVRHYVDYYKINIKDILVIQDDLDLPLATIRIKEGSSSGGHNGIKDIIKSLSTNEFLRLKIGISKPTTDVIDFVLTKFSKEEFKNIEEIYSKTNEIIDNFIKGQTKEELMNKYN